MWLGLRFEYSTGQEARVKYLVPLHVIALCMLVRYLQ